jgi:chloramphenicol-sensitive protein RarD
VLHEQMNTERWIGFGLVWAALILLTVDSVLAGRRGRSAEDVAEPA